MKAQPVSELTDEQIEAIADKHGNRMVSPFTHPKGPITSYQFKLADKSLHNFARALLTGELVVEQNDDTARVQFLIDNPNWSVRWRIHTKKQIQQWQMVDDGESWGQWGEYRNVVDAARRAAAQPNHTSIAK